MNFKFVLPSIIILFAVSAQATESLRILHTGGRTGTTAVIASEYATEFKKTFGQISVEGPGGCVPVLQQVQQNKNPTLVLWDNSSLPTDECRMELTRHAPVATYGVYFALCTSMENNHTLDDFVRGGSRVALSTPFSFWDQWYKSVSAVTGKSYNPVPVGDSGKLVLSLISRETDWAILNNMRAYAQVKDGKLRCVATTNPKGENGLPFLGSKIPGFNRGELILSWSTYVINAAPDQRSKIESALINTHRNAEFKKFLQNSHIIDFSDSAPADKKKFFDAWVDLMSGK